MNSTTLVSTLLALSLITGEFAFAQGRGNSDDRGPGEQAQRGGPQDHREKAGRPPDRREDQGRANPNERREERGAGPNHEFHKGQRLPPEYRHRSYVVDDWRGHKLSAPPRGYHWVQIGGDYVLIAIATGIILQILLGN